MGTDETENEGQVKEHLFTFGLTAVIVWIVLAIAAYITGRIGYQTIEQGLIIENILGILMYAALYPCFRKLMIHTVKPFLGIESENYWNTVWFIPIALFLSGILSHGSEEYTATFLQVISRFVRNMEEQVGSRQMEVGLKPALCCRYKMVL